MIYAMADVVARDGEHAATNYEIRWGYGLDAIDAEELAESCKREALLKLEAGRIFPSETELLYFRYQQSGINTSEN